jgi:hypothetical protein
MRRIWPLLAAVAALAATAPRALASQSQTTFFEAPGALVGIPADRQLQTLAQLQSLGVRALRVTLYWRDVAPRPNRRTRPHFDQSNPSAYHWSDYDSLIDEAVALHWRVLLTISGPVPNWATPHGRDRYSDPSTADFRRFAEAVGRRYGAKVKLFSIWNEPNQPGFLRPQYIHGRPASPAIYRGLYEAGYAGLRASGHFRGTRVLIGETSAVGTQSAVAPLTFLRGLLCLDGRYRRIGHCARLRASGYAQHPYANSRGAFGRTPPNDVTIGTLGRLVSALDRAGAAGAITPHLPIYITEFGVQSYPNPVVGVPLAQQAEFDAIGERIAYENPRVASFSQYLLRDDRPVGGRVVGFTSGLETYRGREKPAFNGFRLPLTVTRTRAGVAFWGLVRPATTATTVLIQYSADHGRSWHPLAAVRSGPRGYVRAHGAFVRERVWRLRWVAPDGTTYTGAAIRAYAPSGRIASS